VTAPLVVRGRTLEVVTAEEAAVLRESAHPAIGQPAEAAVAPDISARLGARLLADISTAPPPPLLIERLDPEGHSILYGTGGAGKGVETAWWIVRLVRDGATVSEVLAAASARYGEGFVAVLATSRVWVNGDPAEPENGDG